MLSANNIYHYLFQRTVHHCAAIFVDNSGVDVILGVLPFVRALLARGTSVILCANEWPALNDVTNIELEEILQHASHICPVIASAWSTGDLVVRSSGQRGPCLDFRTLSVGELSWSFKVYHSYDTHLQFSVLLKVLTLCFSLQTLVMK